MKKDSEIKYPNAANLFNFCRQVLDHKYGGVRVIDQDVGQILGFDPADCSHWKKGKKNIRSIQAMKHIAEHLGVDERLVVDVASGEISVPEAYYEYTGYGTFSVDGKIIEAAKKEFYKRHSGAWTKDAESSFRQYFYTDESQILETVEKIHQKISFDEAPLYLPEIISHYPDIILKQEAAKPAQVIPDLTTSFVGSKFQISVESGYELRPFMRFRIAKAMAEYFLPRKVLEHDDLRPLRQHVLEVEASVFASRLLAPEHLIRREIKNLDVGKDIVTQLAEIFWVSKAFINRRLSEILWKSEIKPH